MVLSTAFFAGKLEQLQRLKAPNTLPIHPRLVYPSFAETNANVFFSQNAA